LRARYDHRPRKKENKDTPETGRALEVASKLFSAMGQPGEHTVSTPEGALKVVSLPPKE